MPKVTNYCYVWHMKKLLLVIILFTTTVNAQQNSFYKHNKILVYQLPDTLKAVQYYTELTLTNPKLSKAIRFASNFYGGGIAAEITKKNKKYFSFYIDKAEGKEVKLLTTGLHITTTKTKGLRWPYNWQSQTPYKFLLTMIADSTTKSTYYTGYVFLPIENKWKLLGSFQKMNDGNYVKEPSAWLRINKWRKKWGVEHLLVQQAWVQRENGTWKKLTDTLPSHPTNWASISLQDTSTQSPTIDLAKHIDSLAQYQIDINTLNKAVASKQIDTTGSKESVYYTMLKEGIGDFVTPTDTVTVFYKGSLFSNNSVFDETKDKPATFPLKRLVKGWQIGLPQCRVGGKIRLYIPSSLAYNIRSRSKAIPPNSILIFDIEVVSAKK